VTYRARMREVLVIGGGVIGLTTAVVLAEEGAAVRVWSREPAERSTSAVAGGLCWPSARRRPASG
jgi:D-amino-acid oxidase